METVLQIANEAMERKYKLQARGFTLSMVASIVSEVLGVEQETVWASGRRQQIVQARSLLCYWAVRELGVTVASLSRRLDLSVTVIGKAVIRGERLAWARKYSLIDK